MRLLPTVLALFAVFPMVANAQTPAEDTPKPAAVTITTASPRAEAQTTDSNAAPAPPQDSGPKVTFGGFVDTYYAWDFDRPNDFQRAYTTQPVQIGRAHV